jgi:hypothetical protein
MKDCSNCANYIDENRCRTMFKPFDDYGCHMTTEQAIEAEHAVSKYSNDHYKTETTNRIIKKLSS